MSQTLARYWWAIALRGAAAILFGIMAFIWPAITILALVYLFAAYSLVDGIFSIIHGVRMRGADRQWWVFLVEGIAGILFAVLAVAWPGVTALVLLYLIAAWAIVTGVFEIVAAIRLRQEINNEWLLVLSGVLSVIFGLLLVFQPGAGALAVIWLIASYAIVGGIVLLILGFRLRGMRGQATSPASA